MAKIKEYLSNKVILTILMIVTVILIVGGTYAFFSAANVTGNKDNIIQVIALKHGEIIVNYPNGNRIGASNIELKKSEEGTVNSYMMKVSIQNTGEGVESVSINWKDVTNTFCEYTNNQTCTNNENDTYVGDELSYKLYECSSNIYNDSDINTDFENECTLESNPRHPEVPQTGYEGRLQTSAKIDLNGEQTRYFVFLLNLVNKTTPQDYNQGARFDATLYVSNVLVANDLNVIAMSLDGEDVESINQSGQYKLASYECDNGETVEWDDYTKSLTITPYTNISTCAVEFETLTTYYEGILHGADPELYQGMIPINISSNGTITVADTSREWYKYAEHKWANAVLINAGDPVIKAKYFNEDMSIKNNAVDETISMEEILQMYVWIPRYKYKLWNVSNGNTDPFAIDIVFEDKDTVKSSGKVNGTFTNGLYYTHPAFTFGTTELNGIWIGKFEPSGTITNIKIKPNQMSLTSQTLGAFFNASRAIENTYASTYGVDATEIDTHLVKNTDWGAMAYLSHSIYGRYADSSTCITGGCEVWINNINTGTGTTTGTQWGPSITGCSGSSVSASVVNNAKSCATNYTWNTNGINASTTGNITGIYDVSGGAWEYAMGNMKNSGGSYYASSSGLTDPGSKYYDVYNYSAEAYTDHSRGLVGDATKETLKTYGNGEGGWYGDYAYLPSGTNSWTLRGGHAYSGAIAGVFDFSRLTGGSYTYFSVRVALSVN